MFICITNNKKRDSDNYDRLINLLELSESLFIKDSWYAAKTGITENGEAIDKRDVQKNYKKGINQIVCNDRETNFTFETLTGEIIEFVGLNNHLEKEI